jgi:hypothetical protein
VSVAWGGEGVGWPRQAGGKRGSEREERAAGATRAAAANGAAARVQAAAALGGLRSRGALLVTGPPSRPRPPRPPRQAEPPGARRQRQPLWRHAAARLGGAPAAARAAARALRAGGAAAAGLWGGARGAGGAGPVGQRAGAGRRAAALAGRRQVGGARAGRARAAAGVWAAGGAAAAPLAPAAGREPLHCRPRRLLASSGLPRPRPPGPPAPPQIRAAARREGRRRRRPPAVRTARVCQARRRGGRRRAAGPLILWLPGGWRCGTAWGGTRPSLARRARAGACSGCAACHFSQALTPRAPALPRQGCECEGGYHARRQGSELVCTRQVRRCLPAARGVPIAPGARPPATPAHPT